MSLPDIPNFRDAGGLPSGSLRPGRVFRSSALSSTTDAQQQYLLELGITVVFDLRTTVESSSKPDLLPAGVRCVRLDVLADAPDSGAAAMEGMVAGTDTPDVGAINQALGGGRAHALMLQTYRDIVTLDSARTAYRAMLLDFADASGAAVVHCTAGKDRTGWGIALLQHIAGADDHDIVANYLLSSEPIERAYAPLVAQFAQAGGDADSLSDMLMVRPEYLRAALEAAVAANGSVDGYLGAGLGLDDATIGRVRDRLTA